MAATGTIDRTIPIGQTVNLYHGRIALDSSHVAAGEAVDFSSNARMEVLICEQKGGYSFSWIEATQTLLVYYVDNNAAADSAQIPVPDTTDLSTVTDIQFIAIGA